MIPYHTYDTVKRRCPKADLVPVGVEWFRRVLVKSDEELALIRHAARAGEKMCEAIIETARPGVMEHEIYAAAMQACSLSGAHCPWIIMVHAPGGESVAWGAPPWHYRPQKPRSLREGDTLLFELFPEHGMYETQQQLTIAIGTMHPDVVRGGEVARASYQAGLEVAVPGRTFGHLAEAMDAPVRDAGGWNLCPHVHSVNPFFLIGRCGFPDGIDLGGAPKVGGVSTIGADVPLAPGMVFAFEPNCVFGRRRVNIGGSVLITEFGNDELNQLPNVLQAVS